MTKDRGVSCKLIEDLRIIGAENTVDMTKGSLISKVNASVCSG